MLIRPREYHEPYWCRFCNAEIAARIIVGLSEQIGVCNACTVELATGLGRLPVTALGSAQPAPA
jgi:ribosomal protein L37AE/L43A